MLNPVKMVKFVVSFVVTCMLTTTCLAIPSKDTLVMAHRIDELMTLHVEPHLQQPTFLIDYPIELSPLAKAKVDEPKLVERFEFFACGREIGNAYSELNDPVDQRERLLEQARLKSDGDDEVEIAACGSGIETDAVEIEKDEVEIEKDEVEIEKNFMETAKDDVEIAATTLEIAKGDVEIEKHDVEIAAELLEIDHRGCGAPPLESEGGASPPEEPRLNPGRAGFPTRRP